MNIVKILGVAVVSIASTSALAQTTCTTDYFGTQTCRSTSRHTSTSTTDYFGNTTTRTNSGTTWNSSTDYFGNTTHRSNNGVTIQSILITLETQSPQQYGRDMEFQHRLLW